MDHLLKSDFPGEWWLPEKPDIKLSGTLKFTGNFHAELHVVGLNEALMHIFIKTEHGERCVLHGVVEIGYKRNVTHFGVRTHNKSSLAEPADTVGKSDLYAHECVMGAHIDSKSEPLISGASLQLGGLDAWCDDTGLSVLTKMKQTIKVGAFFRSSRSDVVNLGHGSTFRTASSYSGPVAAIKPKTVTLRELNSVELGFGASISIDQLRRECGVWQAFLAFCTRKPSYQYEINFSLAGDGTKGFPYLLIMPGQRVAPVPERGDIWHTLLSRSKLEQKTSSTIAAWRDKFETLETPIMLLTGTTYQEGAYLHTELLYYLQALEILHREMSGVNECALVKRLQALYDLYPTSTQKLFPDKDKDMILLKDARNFLTHYSKKKKFDLSFLESGQLYVLTRKARFFVEISIMGALGFADADIKSLMAKFEPYIDVCTFKH